MHVVEYKANVCLTDMPLQGRSVMLQVTQKSMTTRIQTKEVRVDI